MYNLDKSGANPNDVSKYNKFISRTLLDIAFRGEAKNS